MIVYHGTSLERWGVIQRQGLTPRGQHGQSNWTHSIESNPDTIYLTDAYAMHFGLSAVNCTGKKSDKVVIIEIDTDLLPGELVPDEDALEQIARQSPEGLPPRWTMQERTRYYRGKVREFAELGLDHEWSMEQLGTMGHIGTIPPAAFTRIAVIDLKKESALAWTYMDCTVLTKNYQILGGYYRALSKLIFGDQWEPYEMHEFYKLPPLKGGIRVTNLKKEVVTCL